MIFKYFIVFSLHWIEIFWNDEDINALICFIAVVGYTAVINSGEFLRDLAMYGMNIRAEL